MWYPSAIIRMSFWIFRLKTRLIPIRDDAVAENLEEENEISRAFSKRKCFSMIWRIDMITLNESWMLVSINIDHSQKQYWYERVGPSLTWCVNQILQMSRHYHELPNVYHILLVSLDIFSHLLSHTFPPHIQTYSCDPHSLYIYSLWYLWSLLIICKKKTWIKDGVFKVWVLL